jgi:hypothetical protein
MLNLKDTILFFVSFRVSKSASETEIFGRGAAEA